MSFLSFVVFIIAGIVFVQTKNFLVQLLGVALFVLALNPVSEKITGKTIPQNVSMVWHAGEGVYNKVSN